MAGSDKYFASLPSSELVQHLEKDTSGWGDRIKSHGFYQMWAKSYRYYYGKHFRNDFTSETLGIKSVGTEGELKAVTVNFYRSFIKHMLIAATGEKPAFDPRAINTDPDSLQQAQLCEQILDAYFNINRLDRPFKTAAEMALVFGKGFVEIVWEPSLGQPYMKAPVLKPDGAPHIDEKTGQPHMKTVFEGDIEGQALSPLDVRYDRMLEDWSKCDWVEVRNFKNKWAMAARYPHLKDEILSLPTKEMAGISNYMTFQSVDETNDIAIKKFYHKKTDALPNGRYTLYSSKDVIYYDGPIPYRRLPVFRIVPGDIFGTTEGYTDAFDIIDPQEAINVLVSTAFSNQQAFGNQMIWMPEGCNISPTQLQGLAVLKGGIPGSEPKALQLCSTPAEIFKLIEYLEGSMEKQTAINSVVRGDPEHSLKSGVALSIVQAMAVQYSSGFQKSYGETLEDGASFVVELLQDFAKTQRMIALAGKDQRGAMKSFSGKDIQNIKRVIIDLGNALSKTTAGKMDLADNLLNKGMINTPQEYITVRQTGNIRPMLKGAQSKVDLIHRENDDLMDGKPVQAMVGEPHLLHIQEHMSVYSDPELRRRAASGDQQATQLLQNAFAHISQHKQLYQTQEPIWSMISGEPPAPPPPMPPPGPGAPPPGPGGPPPPNGPQPSGPGPHKPQVSHIVHHQGPPVPHAPPPGTPPQQGPPSPGPQGPQPPLRLA